jgi:hypothetical protein
MIAPPPLRIGWATPFNEQSPVARFSREATVELARRGYAVEILRIETGPAGCLAPLPTGLALRAVESQSMSAQREDFDLVVVNLADDYRFHGGAIAILRRVAALILFHDATMAGFLADWARAERTRPERLAALFGAAIADANGSSRRRSAKRANELAWFAALGGGAVAPSDEAFAAIGAASPGPVAKIALPDLDPADAPRAAEPAAAPAGRADPMKAYLDALVPLMEACLGAAPVIAAGRRLGRMLAGLGLDATDPAAARIGEVLAGFFGDRGASGAERG